MIPQLHRVQTPGVGSGDRGDTLIEIVVTVGILGIVMASLLGGLIVSLGTSTVHRSLANLDTVVRSFAEQAERQIELGPNAGFQDCATVSGTTYAPATPPPAATTINYNPPTGYNVSFTSIQYWDSVTQQFDSACGPNDHTGYQLITIQGLAPNDGSESMSFAVRSPT